MKTVSTKLKQSPPDATQSQVRRHLAPNSLEDLRGLFLEWFKTNRYIDMTDDKRVTKYINAVKRRIKEDYGSVPDEWSAQLQQLEDLYSCYLRASDAQKDSEITTTINNSKTICKSPYFTIMLDCTNAMKKVIAEFGLSPRAKAMIKSVPTTDNDDFTDNFLSD